VSTVQSVAIITFWISGLLIAYTYFIYPLILLAFFSLAQVRRDLFYLLGRSNRRARLEKQNLPSVSIIMPAHNEEEHLPAKLENLKTLLYEDHKLEIIIVSDGSEDHTNEYLKQVSDPRIRVEILQERQGKPNALNHAVALSKGEILVFCDAATIFREDAIEMLVRHFANPKIGVVCGSLRFEASEESKQTEGVYWKYETMLRMMEARLGATLTASGALYAMRRNAFTPVPKSTVLEDLIIPMNARKLGFSVAYDPEAIGIEYAAATVAGEFTRRVRIAMGSFRSIAQLSAIPMDFFTILALVSHKFARWFVFLFALVLLASNICLLDQRFYQFAFLAQMTFYSAALFGYLFRGRDHGIRLAKLGYFLVAMNWAFVVGLYRCLAGRDGVKWQKVA
jgi:cellulose synthase/poly-beta-1,6-N-acetylglucosamine synthase-like glycosyltransferase